ncbi:hypothetical protein K435DRAFT_798265 [Dendrothele bispora CBS 962.96]|uniref:Uncharacterized protein n=1 Tax=Dendrothele bispora (strain CBS 962.96) TaxID=1314807 RepID=A0A4V4HFK8_DENBC|nr:hypothetical protein K435DRAFT_798265 [Dendrothele bispora CBS 962.96]
MASVMNIPDEFEDSLEQLVVSNTVAGVLFTTEMVVMYMNLFRFYFALNLAISLVGLRTSKNSVNQDPVILDNTLRLSQRLVKAQGVIHPFNLYGEHGFSLTRKFRVVLSILLLGSIGRLVPFLLTNTASTFLIGCQIWSSQRSLKPYTEHTQLSPSSCSVLNFTNNDIARRLLIILESGLLYVIVWLLAIFADARVLNKDAEISENALLPHLAVRSLKLTSCWLKGFGHYQAISTSNDVFGVGTGWIREFLGAIGSVEYCWRYLLWYDLSTSHANEGDKTYILPGTGVLLTMEIVVIYMNLFSLFFTQFVHRFSWSSYFKKLSKSGPYGLGQHSAAITKS